jgi:hypothetical protein
MWRLYMAPAAVCFLPDALLGSPCLRVSTKSGSAGEFAEFAPASLPDPLGRGLLDGPGARLEERVAG